MDDLGRHFENKRRCHVTITSCLRHAHLESQSSTDVACLCMCTCSLPLWTTAADRDPSGSVLARTSTQPGGPGSALLPHLDCVDLLSQPLTRSLSSDWSRQDTERTMVSPSSLLSCTCLKTVVWWQKVVMILKFIQVHEQRELL